MMKNILVAAVVSIAAEALAAPDLSRFTIGVNEAGYEPDAPKWCVVTNPPTLDYVIQTIGTNIHWRTVRRGRFVPSGKGDGICYGDFSSLTEPGDYRILCGDEAFNVGCARGGLPDGFKGVASFHFIVKDGVYDTLERMLLTYVTWQRCGHRKGWAGLCHQDPVPVRDADGRVVRTIDARGGYHQSNDLRCWHDGISMSIYSLLRYAELRRPLWDEGEIAAELRWGCDYFLRVIAPEGYVYDAQFAPIGWGPFDYYLAPATLGAQCNIVMLLARASRYFKEDGAYAERLLAAAKRIDAQIETNPFFAERRPAPAKDLPAGAQPAERCYHQQWRTSANGLAERCGAALELYRATGDEAYAKLAKACGDGLIARQIVEGEDAGRFRLEPDGDDLAFRDFGYCHCVSGYRMPLELFREFGGEPYRTAALRIADWYVRDAAAKGFGPPHLKRSSTTGAARAIYLCECARLFNRPDDRVVASRLFGWLFGANPDLLSNVEGVGCHHWPRPVFGQFFPSTPQIPGGMLHVSGGEYDMPAVAQTLWACAAIAGPQAG